MNAFCSSSAPTHRPTSRMTCHAQPLHRRFAKAKPLILIFPNYAGEKQFDIDQAVFLARCGYTAVSVDMYQETPYENGVSYPKSNRNPLKTDSREKIMAHFKGAFTAYNWFQLHPKEWRGFQSKFFAAVRKHPAAHSKFAAAIGYCFGGQCCLNMVRAGEDVQGIVSFHGVLQRVLQRISKSPSKDDPVQVGMHIGL